MICSADESETGRHRRRANRVRVLILLVLLALPCGGPTLAAVAGGDAPSLAVVETDKEWMVRVLQSMLEARLSRQPGLVVLEQEDLERLREVKLLTEGEPGGLQGSVVLVDGYLERTDGSMALAVKAGFWGRCSRSRAKNSRRRVSNHVEIVSAGGHTTQTAPSSLEVCLISGIAQQMGLRRRLVTGEIEAHR